MIDREIGPFWVLEQIEHAGGGQLYKGIHKSRPLEVAILELPFDSFPDPAARKRFVDAARRLVGASRRTLASIFLCREENDALYLVTEYLPDALEDRLTREGSLPPGEALHICLKLLDALQYLHRLKISHGSISPQSVAFTAEGGVKLCGFASSSPAAHVADAPPDAPTTEGCSLADDLYAVGAVLYRMVAGTEPLPVDPARLEEALAQAGTDGSLAAALAAVLAKALAPDPRDRFMSAKEFAEALRRLPRPAIGGSLRERSTPLPSDPDYHFGWHLLFVVVLLPLIAALLLRGCPAATRATTGARAAAPAAGAAAPASAAPGAPTAAAAPAGKAPSPPAPSAPAAGAVRPPGGATPHREIDAAREQPAPHQYPAHKKERKRIGRRSPAVVRASAKAATPLPAAADTRETGARAARGTREAAIGSEDDQWSIRK